MGRPEWDGRNGTAGMGRPERDGRNGTAGMGRPEWDGRNGTAGMGRPGREVPEGPRKKLYQRRPQIFISGFISRYPFALHAVLAHAQATSYRGSPGTGNHLHRQPEHRQTVIDPEQAQATNYTCSSRTGNQLYRQPRHRQPVIRTA